MASALAASPHICIKSWPVTGAGAYLHKVMAAGCLFDESLLKLSLMNDAAFSNNLTVLGCRIAGVGL